MNPVDDVGIAIAGVYARALLDVARKGSTEETILKELEALVAEVNRSPDFENFLTSTKIDRESRRATLERAMRGKADDVLVDALQVLNNKERLALLEAVHRQYVVAYEKLRNQIEVRATTAVPLDNQSRKALIETLRQRTGAEPVLSEEINESLIGGMVIHVGDQKFDMSVSRKLRGFHRVLLDRASREIHGGRTYFEGIEQPAE